MELLSNDKCQTLPSPTGIWKSIHIFFLKNFLITYITPSSYYYFLHQFECPLLSPPKNMLATFFVLLGFYLVHSRDAPHTSNFAHRQSCCEWCYRFSPYKREFWQFLFQEIYVNNESVQCIWTYIQVQMESSSTFLSGAIRIEQRTTFLHLDIYMLQKNYSGYFLPTWNFSCLVLGVTRCVQVRMKLLILIRLKLRCK
jgi:hypothetical protein